MSLYFVGFGQTKLQLFFSALISFPVKCSKNILPVKALRWTIAQAIFNFIEESIWKYTMGRNSDTALGKKHDDLIGPLPTHLTSVIELIQRIMGEEG